MSNLTIEKNEQSDELDLRDLLVAVWKGRWFVICVLALAIVLAYFYAKTIPAEYRSTAIVASKSSAGSSSLSNIAGQLGGLASIAGLNLGSSGGIDDASISIEIMKTWGFLESFVVNNNLGPEVYAVTGWIKSDNKLVYNEKLYSEEDKQWLEGHSPSSWVLFNAIKEKIYIKVDPVNGLVSVSADHYSPYIAKKWVELIIKDINDFMKSRDREEAINSIEYLKEQIEKTNISEMRSIFFQLIEEQTKTLMLAEISPEYVFKTISAPRVAEVKVKPNKLMIILLAGILGFLSGLIIVVGRYSFRST